MYFNNVVPDVLYTMFSVCYIREVNYISSILVIE